jgi:ABC-type glycerol-3-phosphate transport system permease component
LQSDRNRTLPLGLVFFANFKNPQPGIEMAGYVLASLPLLAIFLLSMRTFVSGLTSGAIKI